MLDGWDAAVRARRAEQNKKDRKKRKNAKLHKVQRAERKYERQAMKLGILPYFFRPTLLTFKPTASGPRLLSPAGLPRDLGFDEPL
ncbi:uncharacterized protein KY384_005085 [Bacidia gigantensis]|uniref:uncharacterized protein n=1 Tax=Bacidia gigantensis TaxID=2732470 RepID=UPI001D05775A|nr:uncharacterized protein KY384_005085 [Bacidia gigantensis]KAG8530582.1 hypothetical protein KY384_005085 [Bacidia gigantensis]